MIDAAMKGDLQKAAQLQFEATDIINALFCEVNPIPVKKALSILGLDTGVVRLPLYEMAPENAERLENSMKKYGLI